MSRTLKRPMFRRGGSTNNGIMSGLTDRKKLSTGTQINKEQLGLDTKAILEAMQEFSPIPETRLPLGAVGASLVSGAPIKDALTVGYADFIKRDDARRAAARKREQAAVSTALGSQLKSKDAGFSSTLKKAREAFKLGVKNPNTGKPYQSVKEAFDQYQLSLTDIESGSTREQISNRFRVFYSGRMGTEAEAEYDVLKRQGRIPIKENDFGKKDLLVAADREDIADNENFGPGDGFVDISKGESGQVYILKPGGNKDDFTSNSYEIIDLKSLY
jgi:hypothetical protein